MVRGIKEWTERKKRGRGVCRWDRLWLVGFYALARHRCFLENHWVQWWGDDISGSECVLFLFSIRSFKRWSESIPLLVNSELRGITGHSVPLLTFSRILPPTFISNKNIQDGSGSPLLGLFVHYAEVQSEPWCPPPTGPLVLSCAQGQQSAGRADPTQVTVVGHRDELGV